MDENCKFCKNLISFRFFLHTNPKAMENNDDNKSGKRN